MRFSGLWANLSDFLLIIPLTCIWLFPMLPKDIIEQTLKHEGGWSNHCADKGGATNFGITFATYKMYNPSATLEELRTMTKAEAIRFYEEHFFKTYKIADLPDAIQDIMFDMCVNHGPRNAAKILQRSLSALGTNIEVDGKIGPMTIKHANEVANISPDELRNKVNDKRWEFYKAIVENNPSQQVFINGWKNRVDSFRTN